MSLLLLFAAQAEGAAQAPANIDPGTRGRNWLHPARPDEVESPRERTQRIAAQIDEAFNPKPPKPKTRRERRLEKFGPPALAPEMAEAFKAQPDISAEVAALVEAQAAQAALIEQLAALAERERWLEADDESAVVIFLERRRQIVAAALALLGERYAA